MKLREVTPESMRCFIGACPAVFETERGTYVLIGRTLSGEEASQLLGGRIGPKEAAVEVPKALLEALLRA